MPTKTGSNLSNRPYEKLTMALPHDTNNCLHRCLQTRTVFHLPNTKRRLHLKSRTGEKSPTQMAALYNAKMTLLDLLDTVDIALPDARDPLCNIYWLALQLSQGRNGDPHHSHIDPTHYLTNLTSKLKTHMHKRHKLGCANASGYYSNSCQGLHYAIQLQEASRM
eukprot:798336-Pelagomonas_calceolata.AAC.1